MMTSRRKFLKTTALGSGAFLIHPALKAMFMQQNGLEISLAEWSYHRAIAAGKMDHLDFATKAKNDFGINAVEYVNGLFGSKKRNFKDAGKDSKYLSEMLKRSNNAGVVNHLLMVDEEGSLAGLKEKERLKAVDNHRKWLDAAKFLGCKTVRVNLHGEGPTDEKQKVSIDSLTRLGEMAAPMGLNVVVENHGSDSSKGTWLAAIMKAVNKTNVGTLPDFGNFCISHPWGTTQDGCTMEYNRYKGVEEMLPFAKGVSAKSYDFDEKGEQPLINYEKMIRLVKDSGFNGYIGIEFEGNTQDESEGIRKTKALLERYI
ncbi:MAG: TIM barrel protein [Chitinophagaceae bacterium]|nr:TIM barrel protein [Chitinophagaceae bacterium]